MSDTKATPRPWKFDDEPGCRSIKGGKRGDHRQAQYMQIACTDGLYDDEEDRANAALIVRAVNSFDELVAALRLARGYVEKVHGTLAGAIGPDNIVKPDLDVIDAALARAGEP